MTQRNQNTDRTHCRRGHEFTPENTYRHGTERQCRECQRLRKAARRSGASLPPLIDDERPQCSEAGCIRTAKCLGLCDTHYARLRRLGSTKVSLLYKVGLAERFWSSVRRDGADECWLWTKSPSSPYGRFALSGNATIAAHRFAYQLLVGPIPAGLELDHLCRQKKCVNPAHLEVVTSKINNQRRSAIITHCPQGHPYDGDNLYVRPDGRRRCRECSRQATRDYKARVAA